MVDDLQDQTVFLQEDVTVLQAENSAVQDSVVDLQNTDVELDERISSLESSSGGNTTGTGAGLTFTIKSSSPAIGDEF